MANYWVLQANPKIYDIDRALTELTEIAGTERRTAPLGRRPCHASRAMRGLRLGSHWERLRGGLGDRTREAGVDPA